MLTRLKGAFDICCGLEDLWLGYVILVLEIQTLNRAMARRMSIEWGDFLFDKGLLLFSSCLAYLAPLKDDWDNGRRSVARETICQKRGLQTDPTCLEHVENVHHATDIE